MEASLSDLSKAARVYNNAVYRTLSHGTTTAAYYATIDLNATNLLAKICHTRGQRAFVGQVCMDSLAPDYYTDHDAKTSVDKARQSVRYIQDTIDPTGSLIAPIITPRFAPSCSRDCLSGLGQLMKESGLLCQTHMSEVASEFDLVRETYPESRSYADVYDAAGLLNERTVLAHAIYLTARDKELIKARKAKVSHCPCSNTALGSGLAKVREILDLGIDVGLGSDVSGGYSVSILEAARQAILVGRCVALGGSDDAKLSMEEALYLATRGGAAVLGLSERIGGFEVGKQWDAQVVRLHRVPDTSEDLETGMAPVDCFGWETMKERLEKWLYTGDDRNTIAVWVKGRLVHNTKEYGR